jgi:hypothetical protein
MFSDLEDVGQTDGMQYYSDLLKKASAKCDEGVISERSTYKAGIDKRGR